MPTLDQPSPAQLRRSLRFNIRVGLFGTFWIAMALTMPLTLFLEALGATGKQLGLSATLQQMAMAVQIPAALWVDRLRRRKPFWAARAIPHRLIWLTLDPSAAGPSWTFGPRGAGPSPFLGAGISPIFKPCCSSIFSSPSGS